MAGLRGRAGRRRGADERRVDALLADAVDEFARATFLQRQRDQRVGFTKAADDARHEGMERHGAGEADGDAALLAACRAAGCRDRVLDACQDSSCVVEQRFAGLGELDASRLAAEELDVELGFERPDLLTERWLLYAQSFGGAGDVLLLGDGDEVAQMA